MAAEHERLEYQEEKKESVLEWLLAAKKGVAAYPLELAVCLLSLTLSIYHMFVAYAGSLEAHAFRSTHLAFVMVLCFLLRPLGREKWTDPKNGWFALDMVFVLLVIAVQVYTLWDLDAFIFRRGDLSDLDIYAGTVLLLLLLEATRRAVGWAMVIIAGFFVLQTVFSDYFPGIFYGPPSSWFTMMDYLFMRGKRHLLHPADGHGHLHLSVHPLRGHPGALRRGPLLHQRGPGAHRQPGGAGRPRPRWSAPVLMASVSGSAVANVVTTGSFTIPLMKRIGYRDYFAGAVEACASSGGQIMPPVMGAAAFVIAEFMNVQYLDVALASLFPALIYFFSIFVMVHFEARKRNLATISPGDLPSLKDELKRGGHLFLSILVIVVLMIAGYTPMFAAFWAIISILVLSALRPETRMTPRDILSALEEGARLAVPVSIACAAAGIIIGCVFVSGLGLKFTTLIVSLAGGNLWIALILTMIASLILGMGLTTTAVYITLAALVIPALVKMGVEPMSAHLFAFYFGLVSAITPPVALASFAAAGIAGSNPMQTGFHSFRLGIAKYVLPFVFVFAPGLVFVGAWDEILFAILGGFAGIYALTVTTEGWCIDRVGWPVRLLMAFCAFLFFAPGVDLAWLGLGFKLPVWSTDLLAWGLLIAFLLVHRARHGKQLTEAAS